MNTENDKKCALYIAIFFFFTTFAPDLVIASPSVWFKTVFM